MMELSYRQYKILSVILQSKGYVTSKVLTDSLNITRRTLINDIKTINSNNKYIDSDNKGYFINKEFHQEIEDLLLFYQTPDPHLLLGRQHRYLLFLLPVAQSIRRQLKQSHQLPRHLLYFHK